MTANYELWYADDLGNRIAYINDVISFEYVKVLGDIGIGTFQFPNRPTPYKANVPDRRIHIYRQPIGGSLRLDFSCRLRRFDTETTQTGQFWRSFIAHDNNELLRRRIVDDYAGSSQAVMTNEYVDDAMKRLWTQSFDDGASSRDITDYGFSVAANASAGPQIDKQFSWRGLLAVLQDLQADSKTEGNEVFFGWQETETTAKFQTWTNQPGRNLTGKIVFSLERGNLSNPKLSYDHTEEVNRIVAAGQGQQSNRITRTATDTARRDVSRLGWAETFRHSQGDTEALVQADADDELAHGRPRINFSATISDTPQIRYGRDWQIGDKVSISYAGIQMDTIMRSVRVRVESSGREIIDSRVENIG